MGKLDLLGRGETWQELDLQQNLQSVMHTVAEKLGLLIVSALPLRAMEPIKLLCFGIARDITAAASVSLHLRPRPTVTEVRQKIIEDYPDFGNLVSFAIARNEEYAADEDIVEQGDVLAIIPPVSGG